MIEGDLVTPDGAAHGEPGEPCMLLLSYALRQPTVTTCLFEVDSVPLRVEAVHPFVL
jgi:hypothetical protein